jgi:UDP-glucose 4-epimerase
MDKNQTLQLPPKPNVLITGAAGYIGHMVCRRIANTRSQFGEVIGTDLRLPSPNRAFPGISYHPIDIRSKKIGNIIGENKIDVIVHLAAIVSPTPDMTRDFLYDVEVNGTRNLLDAALQHGVKQFIVTSSGAAYGYHADNPIPISESAPLRGNEEFAYSHHKRLVEEMLADYRQMHPQLSQLILRPGTILGKDVNNQITDLFRKPVIMGLADSDSPFVFIWDEDVVDIIVTGILECKTGIYNLAGDGTLTMREIAKLLNKPYLPIPVWMLKNALRILKKVNLTQYGPEQVNFIRYRPVLANDRLKNEFGYTPRMTSREVFEFYIEHQQLRRK